MMDADKKNPGRAGRFAIRPTEMRRSLARTQHPARRIFKTSAFTLVEILTGVAIIAVLASLLLAGGSRMLERTRSAACIANLRQIHVALLAYAAEHNNCLPPAYASSVAWVRTAWPYFGQGEYAREAVKRRGITYCPATKINGTGIFKRDRATWRTDYEVNPNVMSTTQSANNLATMPGKLVMFFDSGGGASGSSATSAQSRASARHNSNFNVLFVDGHAETLNTFTNTTTDNWKKP
jgi:prepilin-type processing-associated H-X9-DG protein